MSKNILKKEQPSLGNNIIDYNELKLLKKRKDTAEIIRFVTQQICQDCINECHKIKSKINE